MNKKNILPEGTRDLILDECVVKRSIERDIDDIFCKWGQAPYIQGNHSSSPYST